MAVLEKAVLGTFRKKIGNVVGFSWKGIAAVRSLPASVANPRTTAQQSQRLRFKTKILFAAQITPSLLKPLWDRQARRMSGYNLFVRRNRLSFDEKGNLDLTKIIISQGRLAAPIVDNIDASQNGLDFNIRPNINDKFAMPTDMLFMLIYDTEDQDILFSGYTGITREESETSDNGVPFNRSSFNSGAIVAWWMFRSAKGALSGNQFYYQGANARPIVVPTPFMIEETTRQMGTREPEIAAGVVMSEMLGDAAKSITDKYAHNNSNFTSNPKTRPSDPEMVRRQADQQSYAKTKEEEVKIAMDPDEQAREANYNRAADSQSSGGKGSGNTRRP